MGARPARPRAQSRPGHPRAGSRSRVRLCRLGAVPVLNLIFRFPSTGAGKLPRRHGPTIIVAMVDKVSTMEVRQRIGDMLNRVALRHDEFIIERKGKPLAALVPVERLEQMRRFARRHALDVLTRQKGGALTEEQATALGVEAQRWARRQLRKSRAKTK